MASSAKKKKLREMEQEDAQGLSRKKLQRTMSFEIYVFLKCILLVAIPMVFFLYSPALIFVMAAYVALYYAAILTERGMNKSVIRANHIRIPKFDSAIAMIVIIVALVGALVSVFSASRPPPKFGEGMGGMPFGGFFMNVQRAIENFASLLTGKRSVVSFGFGSQSPPPMGGGPKNFSVEDLPLEYLFSLVLSTLSTGLICVVFIVGIFSIVHVFLKRRKFARVMNEVIYDGELKILSDEELDEILSFGEEQVGGTEEIEKNRSTFTARNGMTGFFR